MVDEPHEAPEVSIVIPLHQGAATIAETLDSCLRQQEVRVEVVVVDDRSTDGGPALAEHHPVRARVVATPRPGVSAARNCGFRVSRGAYVVFLDADDVLLPGSLRQRLEVARVRGGDSIVLGRYLERWGATDIPVAREEFIDARTMLLRGNPVPPCGVLFPRGWLERVAGPFDEALARFEDWDLLLRLAFAEAPFASTAAYDCVYRIRPSMTLDTAVASEDALRVLAAIEPAVRGAQDAALLLPVLRRSRMNYAAWRASFAFRAGDVGGTLRWLVRAVLESPRDTPRLPLHLATRVRARLRRRSRHRSAFGGLR